MPPALAGAAIIGGATIYSANQAKKGAQAQADAANRALDYSQAPRRTQYGSYVGPASGFMPPQPIQPIQPPAGFLGTQRQLGGMSGRGGVMGGVTGGGGGVSGLLGGALGRATASNEQLAYIDPSIRAMREQSLANVPSYQSILRPQLDTALQGLGQTRGRLEELYGQTNDNAFMDPLLQRLALARGELTRGLVNRGLGGSSFQASALGNFESAAAPGIAQARQQGLQARQGLLTDLANADVQGLSTAGAGVAQLQNLDNLYASVAGQNLNQELAALGLSQADIAGILGAANQLGQAGQLRADASGRLLYGAGQLLPLLGQMGGASTPTGMSQANWV